ncbi:MAG: NADH-quinone oxidoreductase subunit J [Chloroflexi bacterium]|nr:NADH-quinone oxidoreductase subunit J [Chloroflexota bacterium]NOQ51281.1 NADH-quinone oxidoreductase subunit J [Desulfuromonadaceae bacterium]OEU70887.1 MAG: NADH dehydrogenase [Desulfuromonadales bacterium C00003093]
MEAILFYLTALVAIVSAIFVIKCRNPINSALNLVSTFICLAVLYIMLECPFMAAIQIMVYAGAIMVLVIFVIMLLNLGSIGKSSNSRGMAAGGVLAALMLLLTNAFLRRGDVSGTGGEVTSELIKSYGHTELIGKAMFTDFLLPFEIASILLLVAIVGAVIISKRDV